MYIKALKIDVQTSSGPFGFYTEFSRHLNIIRGRNSAGKSTIVHAILYAIGMEELLGAQNENALTYALKDHVEHEEAKHPIISSGVTIEIESHGKTITITRGIKGRGRNNKLVEIQECAGLTKSESAIPFFRFIHDSGSAQIEEGFFTYFEKFLGLNLPMVPQTSGKPVKLYLQYIFAAMAIEQKRGWTDYIANLPYFGIRDARIKIVDYLVGTDVFETAASRDALDKESKKIYEEWQILYRTLNIEAMKLGLHFDHLPKTPTANFNQEAVTFSMTLPNREPVSLIEYKRSQISEHQRISREQQSRTQALPQELTQSIEKLTDELAQHTVAYETCLGNLTLLRASRNSNTINTKQAHDELKKNQAAQKLINYGASLSLSTANDSCPACHQKIGHSLVDLHESTPHMDIGTNIDYLKAQLRMLEREGAGIEQQITETEALRDQISRMVAATKSSLNALRSDLNSNSAVSQAGVRRQLQIEIHLEELEKFSESANSILNQITQLSEQHAANVITRSSLPTSTYSAADSAKYDLFEKMFRLNIGTFDYHSAAISDIEFNRDNLLPYLAKMELREINERTDNQAPTKTENSKPKGNIARESSASDFVRLIWSYLISIYQTSSHPTVQGNHPGFLLLDEPGQHSMATKSQQALFQQLSAEKNLQSIVAASFDDSEATYLEATYNVNFKLIQLADKSIAPI
ncbi:AAA family ATPase [Pseudomonas aeruginosa]|uniref:AAA family ATPase n=1 Tax=Pseudomonas aeruginosa TaxID=287 RepID=UPI003FD54528